MGPHPTTPSAGSPARHTTTRGRVRRAALALVSVVALGGGALVAAAPTVSAGPVQYTVDFDNAAIPPGSTNQAYLDCVDDAGASIPVSVTDPANNVSTYHVPAAGPAANSPGRAFVDVGPGGLFTANAVGHWSVAVACPSYDVFTTSFEVVAPTIGLTITPDHDYDCTTGPDGPYRVGDRETMCFHITNATGQDIRSLSIVLPGSHSFDYLDAGEFPTGTSEISGANRGETVPFAGETLDGMFVYAELGQPGSGTFAVSPVTSFSFPALPAPLEVQITTGLTAGTACADAGGLADRVVDPGTPVYFCYTAHNTSAVTFHNHTVTDDVLGTEFDGVADLAPGAWVSYHAAAPVVATASLSHTLSWWAQEDDIYGPLNGDYAVTVEASAGVTVVGDVTVPPTSTPSTVVTSTTAAPVAAAPEVVSTAAHFTG